MAVAGSLTYDTKLDKDGFQKGLDSIATSSIVAANLITDVFRKITNVIKDTIIQRG